MDLNKDKILKDILLKMNYDSSKTLNENIKEQSVTGAPNYGANDVSPKITQPSVNDIQSVDGKNSTVESKNIYPIPGYKTYYTPKPNDPNGGQNFIYIPINSNISFRESMTLPSNFPKILNLIEEFKKSKPNSTPYWDDLTAQILNKLFPAGTVKSFTSSIDNKKYHTWIGTNKKDFKGKWVFRGYYTQDGLPYKNPNPDEYKSQWEKFVENYGTSFQIGASIIALVAIEYFTAGIGTSLATRLTLEILAELAINIPVSIAERKLGDPAAANLSIIFSFLPLINPKLGRALIGADLKLSESIANKLAKHKITNGTDMAKIYDEILTEPEKYLFSKVMKLEPQIIEDAINLSMKEILSDGKFNKKMLEKLLWKDRDWWKEGGLQFSAAMVFMIGKSLTTHTFSENEYERMNHLINYYVNKFGEDETRKLTNKMIRDENGVKTVLNALDNYENDPNIDKMGEEWFRQDMKSRLKVKDFKRMRQLMDSIIGKSKNKDNDETNGEGNWFDEPTEPDFDSIIPSDTTNYDK